MNYQLPPLNWLRAFEAAARYNNFTTAAKELNLTPAAVSHQVRSLEEHLGIALFERLARSLRLTDKGRAYLPSVRHAFEDLSASTIGLFGAKGKQTINIRCTAAFSVLWLAPRLSDFLDQFPNIDVRLDTAIWTEALEQADIDIDIRFGSGHWSGFNAQKLLHLPSVVVATPETAKLLNSPLPESKHILSTVRCTQIVGCEGRWEKILKQHFSDCDLKVSLTVDTSLIALQLACSGSSLALVQTSYARPYLADGRLTRVLDQEFLYDESHYVLIPDHEGRAKPESLLFRNWLVAQAELEAEKSAPLP